MSVSRWCEASAYEVFSKEMIERCRRLTADGTAKAVELLNRSLEKPCELAGLSPEVKSCLSCHGKGELRDAMGKMRCGACHKFPKRHP